MASPLNPRVSGSLVAFPHRLGHWSPGWWSSSKRHCPAPDRAGVSAEAGSVTRDQHIPRGGRTLVRGRGTSGTWLPSPAACSLDLVQPMTARTREKMMSNSAGPGPAVVIAGIVLLTSAGPAVAVVLEVLLVAAGLDLAVTGALGHCPLYAKLGYLPRSLRRTR